jgi:L-ascorbate metabolism protein UlaG (beta-lactamase superfamily)
MHKHIHVPAATMLLPIALLSASCGSGTDSAEEVARLALDPVAADEGRPELVIIDADDHEIRQFPFPWTLRDRCIEVRGAYGDPFWVSEGDELPQLDLEVVATRKSGPYLPCPDFPNCPPREVRRFPLTPEWTGRVFGPTVHGLGRRDTAKEYQYRYQTNCLSRYDWKVAMEAKAEQRWCAYDRDFTPESYDLAVDELNSDVEDANFQARFADERGPGIRLTHRSVASGENERFSVTATALDEAGLGTIRIQQRLHRTTGTVTDYRQATFCDDSERCSFTTDWYSSEEVRALEFRVSACDVLGNARYVSEYVQLERPEVEDPEPALTFKWTGTAGLELEYDGELFLVDPYLSRSITFLDAAFYWLNVTDVVVNEDLVDDYLESIGPERIQSVLVTHTHFDHAPDAAYIVCNTEANGVGSVDFGHVVRRMCGENNTDYNWLKNRVNVLSYATSWATRVQAGLFDWGHSGDPTPPIDGSVEPTGGYPMKVGEYKLGRNFGIFMKFGSKQIFVGTPFYEEEELDRLRAEVDGDLDVLFLSVIFWNETEQGGVRELIESFNPRLIVPIHFDDYSEPISSLEPGAEDLDYLFWDFDNFYDDMVAQGQPIMEPVRFERYRVLNRP